MLWKDDCKRDGVSGDTLGVKNAGLSCRGKNSTRMRLAGKLDPLRWQSLLLAAVVIPLCAAANIGFAVDAWTTNTRTSFLISAAFALTACMAKAATPMAALSGGILTAAMLLMSAATGDNVWLHSALPPLVTLFLLTLAATRFGKRKKQVMGIAEERRRAAQIAANLGVPALLGATALALSFNGRAAPGFLSAMLVAALAEATADTVSSELGEVLGGEPFLITTFQRVVPGTNGAISFAGTSAGIAGAAAVVLAAVPAFRLKPLIALAAGAGALGGLFFDSLLGATLERRGWLNNDAVNFLSTLAAALLTLPLIV